MPFRFNKCMLYGLNNMFYGATVVARAARITHYLR